MCYHPAQSEVGMRVGSALTLFLCMCLGGCIGATRLPERTQGPQGATQKIDLSFLKTGATSRAEVQEKLKPFNTGVQSQRFFVGRWDTSKWGGWIFLVGMGGGTGGAGRVWHDANLLVEFDEQGVVKRYETFPDKLFAAKLDPIVREAELSPEERMDVLVNSNNRFYRPFNLIVTPSELEFTETGKAKKPLHFRVPREWLTGTGTALGASEDATHAVEILRFSTNLKTFDGPHSKEIVVQGTIPQIITLMRYAAQPKQTSASIVQEK
jgi:hypothetical protein